MHGHEVAMSDDIAKRIADLEGRVARVQQEARACVVELFVDDGARYLVAERLPALGSAVLPAIHDVLSDRDAPAEVRTLAAFVGFEVGDRERSLNMLLDEVTSLSEFSPLAARRLASAGVSEAAALIVDALRRTDSTEVDSVVSYLEALHDLGVRLAVDDRRRLSEGGAWQVETALAQWHGATSEDDSP